MAHPPRQSRWLPGVLWALLTYFLVGCSPTPSLPQENIRATIQVDGKQLPVQAPAGTTVQTALQQAGISLNSLDRIDPPTYTLIAPNLAIKIIRVREVFNVKESIIPFERQTVHNESLPEGKTLLVQQGVNGIEQVTYRQVFEDEQEVSNTVFKSVIQVEPRPEIMMVGVQKPFTPIAFPGKLVYLSGGNAWLMQTTTGNRRPIVTSGDLDGRVFALSPKGDWLLFTRSEKNRAEQPGAGESSAAPGKINSLWAVDLTTETSKPVNLKVDNVPHFAAWVPGRGLTITYSTAEPRATEPGWQANNDLQIITFAPTGAILKHETILDTNMGGLYGWWGTAFAWSPDGALLAYARPDEVGLVDLEQKTQVPLATILPFQTGSSWAWIPGLAWSRNHRVLFFVTHAPKAGVEIDEASPLFDLSALPLGEDPATPGGPLITIARQVGMFAYPSAAPMLESKAYQVAFLQAIFPEQSDSKRYRLVVMDRDGSNRQTLFPPDDRQGLDPQQVAWSPANLENGHLWLAANYQGNLWLVDSETGAAQQVTGDGLISRMDWN